MTKIKYVVLALGVLWGTSVFAVIGADREVPEALAVKFPEVILLRSQTEICSGTVIGPRAILTAAHCASLKDSYFIYREKRYPVTFTSSEAYKDLEHDVAVAMTREPIEGAHYGEIGAGLHHGSEIVLAGFGCTQRGGKSGALHIGTTRVIGLDQDHVLSYSKAGGVLCQGDSGGPAFLRQNGRNLIVAVNSAGDIRNINLNVRLDSKLSRGFLQKVAERFQIGICGVSLKCPTSEIDRVAKVN